MPRRVVVFDTSCLLCSRFIQILLKNDKGNFQYTGYESEFSKEYLSSELRETPETVVFFNEGEISLKSKAVLSILSYTRWPYRWLKIFGILPETWLNLIYDWVARNRYAWFGRANECFIPSPGQKAKFLD